jgi:hypothetical protein
MMDMRAIFGVGVGMSLVSSVVAARLFAWPALIATDPQHALMWLVAPHMFLRFVGLSFLMPGVVSERLPTAWAAPAAYGDLGAGVLAIVATVALAHASSLATTAVWVFNVWGVADLLFAFYQGARLNVQPGWFGGAIFIVTTLVPALLVSHAMIFLLLVRRMA